jgi:hypothetical protein
MRRFARAFILAGVPLQVLFLFLVDLGSLASIGDEPMSAGWWVSFVLVNVVCLSAAVLLWRFVRAGLRGDGG